MGGAAESLSCSQCGRALPPAARYCEHCGTPSPTPGVVATAGHQFQRMCVGDVLDGKWKLESKLGSGGMGAVFLAHDLTLDRKVAVKVLAGALCGDEEFLTRFERESRMTAKLEHPNIVPVFAVGRHFGRPYIVMKALEGVTLARMIRNKADAKTAFTRDELLPLLRQLCSGLGFIHAKGYVHRDIKAGNVFISNDGHVTLLDFGVLRDAGARAITRTGALLGTPHYISPEQAKGVREVDLRSDLYSIGVLAFECLALKPPFTGDSLTLMRMHIEAPPPDICWIVPSLPAGLTPVLAKALSKKPADRHSTALEFFTAFETAWPPSAAAPALPAQKQGIPAPAPAQAPASAPHEPTPAKAKAATVSARAPRDPTSAKAKAPASASAPHDPTPTKAKAKAPASASAAHVPTPSPAAAPADSDDDEPQTKVVAIHVPADALRPHGPETEERAAPSPAPAGKPAEAGKMPAPIAPRVSSSKGMPAAAAPRRPSLKEMPAAPEPAASKPAEAGKMPEAPAPIAPRVSSSKGMPAAAAPRKSSLKEMPAAVEPSAPKVDEPPIALDANSTARISLADLHPPAAAAKVEAPAPVSAPGATPEEASFDERTVMAAVPSAAPRRWPWIAGGVGLLVIVIGVAAILPGPKPAAPVARPPPKAAVPVVEPRKEPVVPAPVVPPTPREPAPQEPAVAARPPAAPEEPVVAPSKPPPPVDKPAVVPRDPAPVRTHAEKHVDEPKPAAKPHPRQVRVISTQGGEPNWASVTIDGDPRGETPLSLELVPGKHRLHVERTGFKTVDRDIVVAAGAGPVVVGIELRQ